MKILNAIHAQNIGGVDQVFRNYTEVLEGMGHEVALLISRNGNEKYQAKKIFRLQNLSQVLDFLHLLLICLRFRPDLVICHSNRIMKWMRFLPVKSVAVNHGISFKSSLHCDFIISINQEIADLVAAAGAKSFVVPNVIKIDQSYAVKKINPNPSLRAGQSPARQSIHPQAKMDCFATKVARNDEGNNDGVGIKTPPVLGIYGRIELRKGFDILLRAAGILQKNAFDFRVKIGGFEVPGSYGLHNLKQIAADENISEKCEFVGTVLDKKNFFKDVDIFCVPSREEPFGLVILEAFLFSTLVISSDSDGGKFLIEDGVNGLLFANENAEDLADKIAHVLYHPEIYSRLTSQAFLRLVKDFSFDSLRRDLSQVLQKCV